MMRRQYGYRVAIQVNGRWRTGKVRASDDDRAKEALRAYVKRQYPGAELGEPRLIGQRSA